MEEDAGLDRGQPQRDRRHRDHRHVSPSCSALMGIAIGPEDPDLPGPKAKLFAGDNNEAGFTSLRSIHPPRVVARDGRNDTVSSVNYFENWRRN